MSSSPPSDSDSDSGPGPPRPLSSRSRGSDDRKAGESPDVAAGKSGELKLVSNPHVEASTERETPIRDPSAREIPPEAPSESASRRVRDEETEGSEGPSRPGLPVWAFVLLALLFAVALGWQLNVAGQLEREIADLEQELAATQSQLGAHQTRLTEIRGGVHALSAQLEELESLVDAAPGSAIGRTPASLRPDASIPARLHQD